MRIWITIEEHLDIFLGVHAVICATWTRFIWELKYSPLGTCGSNLLWLFWIVTPTNTQRQHICLLGHWGDGLHFIYQHIWLQSYQQLTRMQLGGCCASKGKEFWGQVCIHTLTDGWLVGCLQWLHLNWVLGCPCRFTCTPNPYHTPTLWGYILIWFFLVIVWCAFSYICTISRDCCIRSFWCRTYRSEHQRWKECCWKGFLVVV